MAVIKMNGQDLTLLSEGQIWGNSNESQLEVIRKYGKEAAITDLCVLTGCRVYNGTIVEDNSLTGRTGSFWTRSVDSVDFFHDVYTVSKYGNKSLMDSNSCDNAVRPVLQSSVIFSQISHSIVIL